MSEPRPSAASAAAIRRLLAERPAAGVPVWHEAGQGLVELQLTLDEAVEISRFAHHEVDAVADGRETVHWAIAALVSTLRADMVIAPSLVDRFMALPFASAEREEMLTRASNVIVWSQPAADRERLSDMLGRAVEALMARSTS